jgi:hypothetical protein
MFQLHYSDVTVHKSILQSKRVRVHVLIRMRVTGFTFLSSISLALPYRDTSEAYHRVTSFICS